MNRLARTTVVFLFFLSFLASAPSKSAAATITVNHAGCDSLVDAIDAANSDSLVNGCGPGEPGADVILLFRTRSSRRSTTPAQTVPTDCR